MQRRQQQNAADAEEDKSSSGDDQSGSESDQEADTQANSKETVDFIRKLKKEVDASTSQRKKKTSSQGEVKSAGVGILLKCYKSLYIIDSLLHGGAASLTGKVSTPIFVD